MMKIELLVFMTPALRQKGREQKNKSLSIDDNSLISLRMRPTRIRKDFLRNFNSYSHIPPYR